MSPQHNVNRGQFTHEVFKMDNMIIPILVVYEVFDETFLFFIEQPTAGDMEMCQALHRQDLGDLTESPDADRFYALIDGSIEALAEHEEIAGSWEQYKLSPESEPGEIVMPEGVSKARVYWVFQM